MRGKMASGDPILDWLRELPPSSETRAAEAIEPPAGFSAGDRELTASGEKTRKSDSGAGTGVFAYALRAIEATPLVLTGIVQAMAPEGLGRQPAAGEWSSRQILAHLLQVERLLRGRVQAMAGGGQAISVKPDTQETAEAAELLRVWSRERQTTIEQLERLTVAQLRRGATLPRYGWTTVEEQVCEWAYHDLEHLRQLLANAEAVLHPAIGGFVGLYPPPYPEALPLGAGDGLPRDPLTPTDG